MNTNYPPEVLIVNDLREKLSAALVERNRLVVREYKKLRRGDTVQALAERIGVKRPTIIAIVQKNKTYQTE